MAKEKVKSAAEKAMERFEGQEIPAEELPAEGERKEYEVDDFKITPQEKSTHVVNQDEAGDFDADKKSGRFDTDKQTFSRIKDVRADGVEVVIEVDPSQTDFSIHAAVLTTQRVTPKEAIQRAVALNQLLMLDKINLADRKQVSDMVEATIVAVLEAQENAMRLEGATYEDIKRTRKKRLDRINSFEDAVIKVRGQKALDELGEHTLFKKVLEKITK